MMISVGQNSSKNALFQYFIFMEYGTYELELMHLIPIIDTALRAHYTGFIQIELRDSG